jgi:hypothetical protein
MKLTQFIGGEINLEKDRFSLLAEGAGLEFDGFRHICRG